MRLPTCKFFTVIYSLGLLLSCSLWAADCPYIERIPSMGTVFEIQYVSSCGKTPEVRQKLILNIKNILDPIESSMSLYQTSSEITQLNEHSTLKGASPVFIEVLNVALQQAKLTEAFFDITIWPVLKKIQDSLRIEKVPPSLKDLDSLKALVDYRLIRVKGSDISFDKKGVMISLDGIAKGYAVDEVSKFLIKTGYDNFLANFSGNMRAQGFREKSEPWSIVINNPLHPEKPIPIDITGKAVATSGAQFEYYSEDKKWTHLISPKSLRPARILTSATVIGPSATVCDALSTALYVMGAEQGRRIFAQNYPLYRFVTIADNGSIEKFPKEIPKAKASGTL